VVVNDRRVVPEGQRCAMRRRARNADAHAVQRQWVCDSVKRAKLQDEAKYVPLFAAAPPLPLPPPVDEPPATAGGGAASAWEREREGTPPREDSQPAAAADEPVAAPRLGEGVLHDAFGVPGLLFLQVAVSAAEELALSRDPTLFPAHRRPLYKTKDRLVAADLHDPRRFSDTLTAVAERVRRSFDLLGESHLIESLRCMLTLPRSSRSAARHSALHRVRWGDEYHALSLGLGVHLGEWPRRPGSACLTRRGPSAQGQIILGISLGGGAWIRFRGCNADGQPSGKMLEVYLPPGSAYAMTGTCRSRWMLHAIVGVQGVRRSLTLRCTRTWEMAELRRLSRDPALDACARARAAGELQRQQTLGEELREYATTEDGQRLFWRHTVGAVQHQGRGWPYTAEEKARKAKQVEDLQRFYAAQR